MRVCVADDHDAVRAALRELLHDLPDVEAVVEATSGEEAVAAARAGDVDLVLMDVSMPVMDGVAATRRIREEIPQVRVVALTAAHDPDSVAAMLAAGADSYLVKTAEAAGLRDSLRRIFAGDVVLAAQVLPVVVGDLARRLRAEEERVDELVALDQTKREFISLVSDQLRTPLTAISGYVKTLRGGWARLGEDVKTEFLERIDQQTALLERRVEHILTVAGLSAQRDADGVAYALDAVVREVLDRVGHLLGDRQVAVDLQPVELLGDRRGVTEVVFALVHNALVHTGGAIRLRLSVEASEAVFDVADDGPGIDPAVLWARLRQPFLPGDPSDTRTTPGMGVSLYIAKRVVDAAGGRLEFETGPDRGTLARVRLPVPA